MQFTLPSIRLRAEQTVKANQSSRAVKRVWKCNFKEKWREMTKQKEGTRVIAMLAVTLHAHLRSFCVWCKSVDMTAVPELRAVNLMVGIMFSSSERCFWEIIFIKKIDKKIAHFKFKTLTKQAKVLLSSRLIKTRAIAHKKWNISM